MSHLKPSIISEAAQRLAGIVNQTPVITSRTLNQRTGADLFLKCENFQRVGAFKFRGAYNAVSQLTDEQKNAGVITHSSGNHAQGLALAAQLQNVRATIVMPEDAPAIKRAATAAYGAEIVPCAAIDREKVTAELVAQHGYTLIHPYDNDHIIAGQGTAAWELFAETGPLDYLFVPVGGGGLISGSALAAAAQSPGCQVIGVEPELGADANQSWREKRIVTLDHVPATVADGLRTRFIGQRNLAVMQEFVADMTTASEEAILETLKFLWMRLKIIVEPSSAAALAPLFTGQFKAEGKRIGVILSGGNVDIFNLSANLVETQSETASKQADSPQPDAASDRPRVLVCTEMDEAGLAILRDVAEVTVEPGLNPESFIQQIGEYQALIVGPQQKITDQMIEYGFHLRAIGNLSSRLDNIDVSTARDVGIEVCNAPGSSAVAIAEHTMTRLLLLANQFGDGRLAGKTLGLIGFGHIAQQISKRARAFDMRIIVNQPRLTPELALDVGAEAADLADLLPQADFVSLHVPIKAETDALIGPKNLAKMKPSACLVNTGHTDLINEPALLTALENGRIAGAALSSLPQDFRGDTAVADQIRRHPRVIVSPHVTTILDHQQKDVAVTVAKQIAEILQKRQANETLALELVPIEQVLPHEQIDDKRVARLMGRLEKDGRLVNPPVTTFWDGRYIVLDGATRSTAFKRLGYKYLIVQVARPEREGYALHTWYHAISSPLPFADLNDHLKSIAGLILTPLPYNQLRSAFKQKNALCYFLDRDGQSTLAQVANDADRLAVMNELVARYTSWGRVERTLLTDLPRLLGQFPEMTAVAIFPQFKPETVFDVASRGELLPAGLTRFVIPGRILRLNAELERLKKEEPLPAKRAWFNNFLEEKLARSRMRYYQEPVILLDE
jgi:threonine dehydratase